MGLDCIALHCIASMYHPEVKLYIVPVKLYIVPQNHRNGDHMKGYQWGGRGEECGGEDTGNKKHNW